MNLGGGGECPLLFVGIQLELTQGIERAYKSQAARADAKQSRAHPGYHDLLVEAYNLMSPPPVDTGQSGLTSPVRGVLFPAGDYFLVGFETPRHPALLGITGEEFQIRTR